MIYSKNTEHGFSEAVYLLVRPPPGRIRTDALSYDADEIGAKFFTVCGDPAGTKVTIGFFQPATIAWLIVDIKIAALFIVKYADTIEAKMTEAEVTKMLEKVAPMPTNEQLSMITRLKFAKTAEEIAWAESKLFMAEMPKIFSKAVDLTVARAEKQQKKDV